MGISRYIICNLAPALVHLGEQGRRLPISSTTTRCLCPRSQQHCDTEQLETTQEWSAFMAPVVAWQLL